MTEILDASAKAFIEFGYRGTRLDQIARQALVSVGTLYLYARGKEALFELTLRRALGDRLPEVEELPFRGTAANGLVDWVWGRFEQVARFPTLERANERPAPPEPLAEFEAILHEVWNWQATYWQAIELIERCARDWPELHMLYFRGFRRRVFGTATGYLARRMEEGAIRRYPDAATAARAIAENIAFFAMHRHVRPDSADLDGDLCRATVMQLLVSGFTPMDEPEA